MFTFTLLLIILSLVLAAVFVIAVGGLGVILALSDVIICGVIIGLIIRLIFRKR